MVTDLIIQKFRERYPNVHPLMFHRSIERARSDGDLFDILDSIPNEPKEYPLVWDEKLYRWVVTNDIYQSEEFLGEL